MSKPRTIQNATLLNVRLDDTMKQVINAEAEKQSRLLGFNVTMSDIARKALLDYIEKISTTTTKTKTTKTKKA